MTETQRRIEAYQKALPDIKEKVVAVAMLLALSVIMLTSASFAWLTISRAPEVTAVSTNVAANGNLEIALAKDDFSVPDESKVGDSSAAKDQNIVGANVTWGNLVNLNDESYGLENIVLRPALINNTASNLLEEPLKGANYGSDGRLDQHYSDNFEFTSWVINDGTDDGFEYLKPTKYGVRAISTIEYQSTNKNYPGFLRMIAVADSKQQDTDKLYQAMVGNKIYIDALAGVIGDFMTDKLNDKGGNTNITKYMEPLYKMLEEFYVAVESYGDTLVALANAQVYNKFANDGTYTSYTYSSWENLLNDYTTDKSKLTNRGISLESISKYIAIRDETHKLLYGDGIDYSKELNSDEDTTNDIKPDCFRDYYLKAVAKETVTLNDVLADYVNKLVDINSCQIICEGNTYTVGGIGMSAATTLLGKDVDARITKGVLKDFEQLSGCKMNATNVTVKATYIFTVSMTAKTITTSAAQPFTFNIDKSATEKVAEESGEMTGKAQDTYGMAIDYWVRTNAKDSYLVLEGNVLTETNEVRETGVNIDGTTVDLWTVTVTTTLTDENNETQTVKEDIAVYKYTTEDGEMLRNANTHAVVVDADGNVVKENETADVKVSDPIARMKKVTTVIGYEGANRVWDSESNEFIDADNTTQGNGSCYIFYAEDPGQQEYCLRLLSNLRVAFLDANEKSTTYGKVVAIAKLDIENRYEVNGKVTLPLVLFDDGSNNILETTEGGLAICELEKNTPTKLTTIVYLNGTEITNADVLAASNIQGQLNIQFGTTDELEPIRNEELETQTRTVTVIASKDPSNYPSANSTINFDYDKDTDMTVHLKLAVEGDTPAKITAFFMRKVNDFQGSREKTLTFEKEEDGFWYTHTTFATPGEYVMKTVQLDGVDYNLGQTDDTQASGYPHVKISGFNISYVNISYNGSIINKQKDTIMTGDKSAAMDLEVKMDTDQKEPSSVRLQFVESDGTQVFATLAKDITSQSWKGSVNFTTSGVYKLEKIILDGEYTELPDSYKRELELYLGMAVEVNHKSGIEYPVEFGSEGSEKVGLSVRIFDNTGEEIKHLSTAQLLYGRGNIQNFQTKLTWDGSENCYKANVLFEKPGVYKFVSVMVNDNAITATTNNPPTYTRISPDPVSFVTAENPAYAYYIDSDDTELFSIKLKNAESATATLELINEHENNKVYHITANAEITDDDTNISTFYFDLKNAFDKDNGQTEEVKSGLGKWKVQKLSLVDVSSGTGDNVVLHEAGRNPLDYTEEVAHLAVELVSLKVTVTNNAAENELKDETLGGDNTPFMGTATASNPITIKITDHRGEALNSQYASVTAVPTIDYKYTSESSLTHGGYVADNINNEPGDITLTGVKQNDGKTFKTNNITLGYAGAYVPNILKFSITVNGATSEIKYTSIDYAQSNGDIPNVMDLPTYTLKTVRPSVTISAISPTGTFDVDKTGGGSGHTANGATASISSDKFTANVYFKCVKEALYGTTYHTYINDDGYYNPQVTLKLSGISGFTSATLSFGNADSSLYTEISYSYGIRNGTWTTNTAQAYSWTKENQEVMRYVGYCKCQKNRTWDVASANGSKTPVGTITANQLTVEYGGKTYVFTIPTVTINNPY